MHVLVAGESWITQSTDSKGVDHVTVSAYVEGIVPLRDALEVAGHTVELLPAHLVPDRFPFDEDGMAAHDVLERSETRPNRLQVLADWVRSGGGLAMVGGYLSFSGSEAKAAFGGTPVEQVLPVTCVPIDDAEVLATIAGDPLIAVREVGAGRTAVFTSDCSPHWAPPEFCEDWDGYAPFWQALLGWTARVAAA